jgi:hypothetical protein
MGTDTKADPLSLFFLASDKLMPSEMRERALLYGAIYRIGFQLVLFTIIGCLVVPIGILFRLPDPPIVQAPRIGGVTITALAIVIPCIFVPFFREAVKHKRRWPSWKFVLVIVLLVAGPCVVWLDLPYRYLPWSPQADYWYVLAVVGYGLPWGILRLTGPLKPRWQRWTGETRAKPDVPHSELEIALLDGGAVLVSLAGLISLSGRLANVQILGLVSLQALALILSFLKKHERQLQGIYRNQVNWLDSNLEQILALAGPLVHLAPNVEAVSAGSSPKDATVLVCARRPATWLARWASRLRSSHCKD